MSSPNQSQPRKTMGRRKVNMEKMEKQSNLQVTFSKRRAGLFKKASELCTLSGAEVAIVVFSPGRKAYSFGHPNVNTIIERYSLQLSRGPANNRLPWVQSDRAVMELTQLESLLEKEKSRAHELDKARKAMQRQKCIPSIDTLDLQQLNHLKLVLQNLENNFQARVQNVTKPMISNLGTGGGYPSVPHHFVNYDFSPAPGSDQGTNGGENDDDTSQELETGYGRRFF